MKVSRMAVMTVVIGGVCTFLLLNGFGLLQRRADTHSGERVSHAGASTTSAANASRLNSPARHLIFLRSPNGSGTLICEKRPFWFLSGAGARRIVRKARAHKGVYCATYALPRFLEFKTIRDGNKPITVHRRGYVFK